MKIPLLSDILRNLFSKPATIEYPKVDIPAEEGYRGLHRVDAAKCISCRLCAMECPTGAITMKKFPYKEKEIPVIDLSLCIFCYHCVYVCPVKAYVVSTNYHLSTGDKRTLISEPIPPSTKKNN